MTTGSFALPARPDRTTLDDNSYAAIILDMLERLTSDPDALDRGWVAFWTRLPAGDVFNDAARAALDAAVPLRGTAADDRFAQALRDQFGTPAPAPSPAPSTGGKFLQAVKETFGK